MTMARCARLGVLAWLALVVAGCGGAATNGISADTAAQAVTAMEAAVKAAHSVHIAGSISQSGSGGGTVTLDISVATPHSLMGSIELSGQGGILVDTVDGTTFYLSPNDQFWTTIAGRAAVSQLTGKCLVVSSRDSAFSGLAQNIDTITDFHSLLVAPGGAFTKVGTTSIKGSAAQAIRASDGSIIDISSSGTPYPLQFSKAKQGELTFSGWNAKVSPQVSSGCLTTTQLATIVTAAQ